MSYRKTPKPDPRIHTPQVESIPDKGISFDQAFPMSPEGVPLPSTALTVNLSANGELVIYIPPSRGHSRGNTCYLPANQYGFGALHRLLLDRQRTNAADAKIGTRAAPTRNMLEAYADALARGKPIVGQKLKLDDLDLSNLSDFEVEL